MLDLTTITPRQRLGVRFDNTGLRYSIKLDALSIRRLRFMAVIADLKKMGVVQAKKPGELKKKAVVLLTARDGKSSLDAGVFYHKKSTRREDKSKETLNEQQLRLGLVMPMTKKQAAVNFRKLASVPNSLLR